MSDSPPLPVSSPAPLSPLPPPSLDSGAPAGGVPSTRLVAGRYRLTRAVGVGGMSDVWEATDELLGRTVAVKLLRPDLLANRVIVERFRREAVAAAQLHHPGIVAVYDTVSVDGVEAIVMELVSGTTLRQRIDTESRLEVAAVIDLGAQLAGALDAAHRNGIVHRDLKPGNVLVTADGRARITDFGIAKSTTLPDDLTADDVMLGTAKYLAPEQVTGAAVDGRTDLFSLGVVLYECLTGQVPFLGETDAATALARLRRRPIPVRNLRRGVPRALSELIGDLLEQDPARRPPTAAAVRDELLRLRPADDDLDDPTLATSAPATEETSAPMVRHRGWIVPASVIVAIALAVGLIGVLVTPAGSRLIKAVTGPDDTVATTAAPPSTIVATTLDVPTPTITQVVDFDPRGDQHERPDRLAALLDGNPSTAWTTEGYKTRNMRPKEGVGVLIQLSGSPRNHQLIVDSSGEDWSAELYLADEPGKNLKAWGEPVMSLHGLAATAHFAFSQHEQRYALLWITDLGTTRNAGLYRLAITSLTIE